MSVEARTQPCLYAGTKPCGEHGACAEVHKGEIKGGYRGIEDAALPVCGHQALWAAWGVCRGA